MSRVAVVQNPRRRRSAPAKRRRRRHNPSSYALTNPRRKSRRRRHRNPLARLTGGAGGLGSVVGLAGDAALVVGGMMGGQMLADRVIPPGIGSWGRVGLRLLLAVGVEKFGSRVVGQRVSRSLAVGMAAGAVQDAIAAFQTPAMIGPAPGDVRGYVVDDGDAGPLLASGFGSPAFSQGSLGVLAPRF